MIKVGIIGGSNPMAGELVRLLINHPDVVIKWMNSARYAGRLVSDVHHGLTGETDLRISPTVDLENIDVLFIFRHKGQTVEWLADRVIPDTLHIIDLSVDMQDPRTADEYGFVYGLPELNRKPLVRGAQRAIVPHPVASITALSLMPLAKNDSVDNNIKIEVSAPRAGEKPELSPDEIVNEAMMVLRELQPSLNPEIKIDWTPDVYERALGVKITMPTGIDIGSLTRMFEEFYDDHNFVFIVSGDEPEPRDIEGTNKCLIYLDKRDGKLVVTAMMDALLKGAAGSAVHIMNLLFGLAERTGLALKASTF